MSTEAANDAEDRLTRPASRVSQLPQLCRAGLAASATRVLDVEHNDANR